MKELSDEEVEIGIAYLNAVESLSGVWPSIEDSMVDAGFENPEEAVEKLRTTLYS